MSPETVVAQVFGVDETDVGDDTSNKNLEHVRNFVQDCGYEGAWRESPTRAMSVMRSGRLCRPTLC
jgi:hypothetical protein